MVSSSVGIIACSPFERGDHLACQLRLIRSVSLIMSPDDVRFPLGAPLNRPLEPALRPIAGRPDWFIDSRGKEYYIEHSANLPTRQAGTRN
jgi:hypothetical protein